MIAFADRVRAARQKIRTETGGRMTQGDLAAVVGVERNTISRWENKGIRPKDPEVMQRLADALHVRMEWLVTGGAGGTTDVRTEAGAESGTEDAGRYGRSGVLTQPPPWNPYQRGGDLAVRLPPRAYEMVHGYATRVEGAGGSVVQVEEVWRVLSAAAFNALRPGDPRERSIEALLADIESAWDYAAAVLRREGRAV